MERSHTGVGLLTGEEVADRCGGSVIEVKGEKRSPGILHEMREICGVFRALKDFGLCLKMVWKPLGSSQQRSDVTLNRKVSEC